MGLIIFPTADIFEATSALERTGVLIKTSELIFIFEIWVSGTSAFTFTSSRLIILKIGVIPGLTLLPGSAINSSIIPSKGAIIFDLVIWNFNWSMFFFKLK